MFRPVKWTAEPEYICFGQCYSHKRSHYDFGDWRQSFFPMILRVIVFQGQDDDQV